MSLVIGQILTSTNTFRNVTNYAGYSVAAGTSAVPWLPLGTVGDTATGEIGVKVIIAGAAAGGGGLAVQGLAADNAATSGNPVYVSGKAVTGSSYAPAYTVGDVAAFAIDAVNGGLLCDIRKLTAADDVVTNVPKAAPNFATGQVATSTTAATFVVARATRRSVTLKNEDAAITVYIGPATVTSGNGFPLKANQSISVAWVGLIQVIAASGTPTVSYADEYD